MIFLAKNPMFYEIKKHIDIKLYFIRDIVNDKKVKMEKVSTVENSANMMSTPIPLRKFKLCLELFKVGEGWRWIIKARIILFITIKAKST